LINVENKTAYPYITQFKKEPFKSFTLKKSGEIKSFFLTNYDKVLNIYNYWNKNLLFKPNLNLENIFWFLLFRKYLKQSTGVLRDELYHFILSCEVDIIEKDQLGFKLKPDSSSFPDIWSLYYSLISLNILGLLEEYLSSRGQNENIRKIKNFLNEHFKGNSFVHCLDKNCDRCKILPEEQTFYYVIEIYTLLGIDIRLYKERFKAFLTEKKKGIALVFKFLFLKYFDLDSEIKEKELQYVYQLQQPDGGFSLNSEGSDLETTFWIINVLENYSWLIDYNPAKIFSYITQSIEQLLSNNKPHDLLILVVLSQVIIILSLIWSKFIEEIERVLFQRLEDSEFIDTNQLKNTFGLSHGIDEIITYINLSYTIELRVIDNKLEFERLLENLSQAKKILIKEVYSQLSENSIISLSDIFKKYKSTYHYEPLKLKEDIFPIIEELIKKHFFTGEIRAKKGFLFRTKYFFYLDFLFERVVISDREVKSEKLLEEKAKLKDIRNDIYNMILKLKSTVPQIKEEIESYLYLEEIEYAKERLKFILRNALMEADFLNENIESSFNQNLSYINLQAVLASDIKQWKNAYALLKSRLIELNSYLQQKIKEREELRKFNNLLDELDNKVYDIEDYITRELDLFRNYISEILEDGYSEEKFNLIIKAFTSILDYMNKSANAIYRISHQITSKEKKLIKKHKKVIDNWVNFKEKYDSEFKDYTNGFEFFNNVNRNIFSIKDDIKAEISKIKGSSRDAVKNNRFQEAFDLIKSESEILLNQKVVQIKEFKDSIKKEAKFKQKLYPLYKYLQEKLDSLEENILELIAEQVESLRDKVLEERNKANIQDFNNFINNSIQIFKDKIEKVKKATDASKLKQVDEVNKIFDEIMVDFEVNNKKFLKKYNDLKNLITNYDEISISVKQYETYKNYFQNEIENLKEDYINSMISEQILVLSRDENSDTIDIKELSNKINIKCKVLIPKLKDLIEISRIQGDLFEDKKELLVHSEDYYKNKELKNFVEKKILKFYQEAVGKILALYDSCIKNKTLGVNLLEIQNRISDVRNLEVLMNNQIKNKILELNVDEKRSENIGLKKDIDSIISNNKLALENISRNLIIFKELQIFVDHEYSVVKLEMEKTYAKVLDFVVKVDTYDKLRELINDRNKKLEDRIKNTELNITEKLKSISSTSYESKKFETEIREYYVRKKNELNELYQNKIEIIEERINVQKFEKNRNELINNLNKRRIYLSQLLGTLQARIEDFIETEQFKRAYLKVIKRQKDIEDEIKSTNKDIRVLIKDYSKQTRDFETRNKHITDDFDLFLKEFNEILREKIKVAEESILKSYITMAIKAVANEYLTLSFLQNELKIKKPLIQHHIISLISSGELSGKYDPNLGLYYENPEILNGLNESELEVIKKMNFRFYMFYNQFRNFTKQNYTIFTFVAALLSITLSLSTVTGGNPSIFLILIVCAVAIIIYIYYKKRKEKKV
jgi:hypothetical protein